MAKRILVIDDDSVTRTLLEKTIQKAGFEVSTAADGLKGFDLIQTTRPEVVILDMLLPKVHGLEVCARIRRDPLLDDVRIILMSAVYKTSSFRSDIEKSGADYFIDKPLNISKLVELINKITSKPEGTIP